MSDVEQLQKGYRRTAAWYAGAAYILLFFAAISPVASIFDMRPAFEAKEIWFQRSGALTTILALLANQLRDMGERSLHEPGTLADKFKIDVLSEYRRSFQRIFWLAFMLTVLGTIVWGYGDTVYKMVVPGL